MSSKRGGVVYSAGQMVQTSFRPTTYDYALMSSGGVGVVATFAWSILYVDGQL